MAKDEKKENGFSIAPSKKKLTKKNLAGIESSSYGVSNPWVTPSQVDKYTSLHRLVDSNDPNSSYHQIVETCRFQYRHDPVASSVINKIIDIAINGIVFHGLQGGKVKDNQRKAIESLRFPLKKFAEYCALEYLTSGLLIPEWEFTKVTDTRELRKVGIKNIKSLYFPTKMWAYNAEGVDILSPMVGSDASYFLKIPEELATFIKGKGTYGNGVKDPAKFKEIKKEFPELVKAINDGQTAVLLDPQFTFRRKLLTDSPFPTPYLYPVLESLKHKRQIRKMDYSLASRVTSAILQFKVGSDLFPVTESDDDMLTALQSQVNWNSSTGANYQERIYALFTHHLVDISWVTPDMKALLDDVKYKSVNRDILYGLGFPNVLVTGENERTQSSDADIALISPEKTMENMRTDILQAIECILFDFLDKNRWGNLEITATFSPINLKSFKDFSDGLQFLYTHGNLSRESITKVFGFDIVEELNKRADEDELLEDLDVTPFQEVPHSNTPTDTETETETEDNVENVDEEGENV